MPVQGLIFSFFGIASLVKNNKNKTMFELLIDKQIGEGFFTSGVTPDYVRAELAKAGAGEDVRITINSPGGDLWDCIAIYNIIRDFARNHMDIAVSTYIQGIAASAASIIALAAHSVSSKNKIIVEDNSTYMIHNGWSVVTGDRNDLRARAEAMERTDDLIANCYSGRTGKSVSEIKRLMDAESWYFGKEIVEAGFADEVIETSKKDRISEEEMLNMRNSFIVKAQAFVIETQNAMKKNADKMQAADKKIAACLKMEIPGGRKAATGKNTTGGCKMTAEEFKKNNPEVYAAIVAEGQAEGVKLERERASRLLAMGDKCNSMKLALDCIRDNKNPADAEVVDAFMDAKISVGVLAAQKKDESGIPDVNPPKDTANGGRDNAAVMAAFDKELGGNL